MNNLDYTRFAAEWEAQEAILLAWPNENTDWSYMLKKAQECYQDIIYNLAAYSGLKIIVLVNSVEKVREAIGEIAAMENIYLVEQEYNDTWARDYGPLTVVNNESLYLLDFGFNGWGLKFASDKDNLVNLRMNERGLILQNVYRNNRDFVLEGGSVETDGCGTILTTSRCLCSPNRNGGKQKDEINKILWERLGARNILWLDYGALEGDDTDSHIDTLARMCPHDTIVYCGAGEIDDVQHEELTAMANQIANLRTSDGKPYNLVELPLPDAVFSVDGDRLPATYCNYLVTPKCVFVPTYGSAKKDALALQMIGSVYSDREVIGIECLALLEQHGSLHCATMQLMPGSINLEKLNQICRK